MRLPAAAGLAAAMAAVPGVSAEAAETLRCEPRWPVFCANLHVGCAGRSKIPADGFEARFDGGTAEVSFDGGAHWGAVVTGQGGDRVLRPAGGRDWVRIEDGARFSRRIHRRGEAYMSAGKCAPAQADRGGTE